MSLPTIEKPTFSVTLPTGKEIKYRPFTVKEQKNLLIAAEGGSQKDIMEGIVQLVDSCTFNKVDWLKEPAVNLEYAFLMIRSKSVGEVVEMAYQCKAKYRNKICDQRNHLEVDIREATFNEFPDPNIKITDNITMVMEPILVSDLIQGLEGRDLVFSKTKMVLHGENAITEFSSKEFEDFLDSFPPDASERLDSFFKNQPTLILRPATHCAKCGNDSHIELKGVLNFFG